MKRSLIIPAMLVVMLAGTISCGYEEKGHANTPAENPGSQTKTGVDTVAHPGNIDRDTIRPEN